jgi:AraC family transcriptional regulator
MTQTLSIKMAWRGRERYRLAHREVGVDDDHYLILNEGSRYGSVLQAPRPAFTFAVFMRPGQHEEVRAARRLDARAALAEPAPAPTGGGFSEHLRAHDAVVSPALRAICAGVMAGERSEDWLEQQLLLLLDGMIEAEAIESRALGRLARARPSTEAELARRLRLAADFIETCHAEPIGLDEMAAVACLSRFHFVRHFKALFGVTPHARLVQRRARTARRLLQDGEHDLDRVAAAAGFGSRSSLRRGLAKTA